MPNLSSDQLQERRVRAAARRQGLALAKSRVRNPAVPEYGTYMLTDPYSNTVVAYGLESGYGLSLDEIEEELRERDSSA